MSKLKSALLITYRYEHDKDLSKRVNVGKINLPSMRYGMLMPPCFLISRVGRIVMPPRNKIHKYIFVCGKLLLDRDKVTLKCY